MSQTGRRRKNRGRSGKNQKGRTDYRSRLSDFAAEEDSATFWARSNARLGIDENKGDSARGRSPVEYPCAVCGVFVGLERMPKDRHDVVCSVCRGALGTLYDDEDQEAAADFVRVRKSKQRGLLDGLPEMSPEDLEAVGAIKALFDSPNSGRSGNKRRGGGHKNKRRRGSTSAKSQSSEGARGQSRGGRRRRRGRRGGSGGASGSSGAPTSAE